MRHVKTRFSTHKGQHFHSFLRPEWRVRQVSVTFSWRSCKLLKCRNAHNLAHRECVSATLSEVRLPKGHLTEGRYSRPYSWLRQIWDMHVTTTYVLSRHVSYCCTTSSFIYSFGHFTTSYQLRSDVVRTKEMAWRFKSWIGKGRRRMLSFPNLRHCDGTTVARRGKRIAKTEWRQDKSLWRKWNTMQVESYQRLEEQRKASATTGPARRGAKNLHTEHHRSFPSISAFTKAGSWTLSAGTHLHNLLFWGPLHVILCKSTSPKRPLPLRLSDQIHVRISHLPRACYMPHQPNTPRFTHSNNTERTDTLLVALQHVFQHSVSNRQVTGVIMMTY